MARPRRYPKHEIEVREDLQELLNEHNHRMVSPGGAAEMLGVKRQTVESMVKRGRIKAYQSPPERGDNIFRLLTDPTARVAGPRWMLIPVAEVERYAQEVGRSLRRTTF